MPVIGMIRFSARDANFFLWGWILKQVQNGIYSYSTGQSAYFFLDKQTTTSIKYHKTVNVE